MKEIRSCIIDELRQNKIDELEALKKMLMAIEREQKEKIKTQKEKIVVSNRKMSVLSTHFLFFTKEKSLNLTYF